MSRAAHLIHVFDLGDVLILVDEERFFEKLRAGCRPGLDAARIFREEYERAAVDRGGHFESLHPVLVREAGLTLSPAELRLAWSDIFTPDPQMLELVSQSPRPRFLLSNTNEPHVTWLRRRFPEIFPLFDHCIFSHEIGLRKPDLHVFPYVESLSGRPPERHVLIDDLARHIAAARAAGWHAILFRGLEDCRRRLADLAASS